MADKIWRVMIIVANYYDDLTTIMIDAAKAELFRQNAIVDVAKVAGTLELAPAVHFIAQGRQKYDGYVVLGCLIKGDTEHYNIVANQSIAALQNITLHDNIAIGTGIIIAESEEQARDRASSFGKNRPAEAVKACISLMKIKSECLGSSPL